MENPKTKLLHLPPFFFSMIKANNMAIRAHLGENGTNDVGTGLEPILNDNEILFYSINAKLNGVFFNFLSPARKCVLLLYNALTFFDERE